MTEADIRVIEAVSRSATGVSASKIAKAHLGDRSRRHSAASLTAIGLQIACRLVGDRVLQPARGNKFIIATKEKTVGLL